MILRNTLLFIIGILLCQVGYGQKYFTRSGITEFKASENTFEPIEATNKSSTAILDMNSGDFATRIFIAGFQFENALMQEHFNENYMDSHLFPKSTFKGKIKNLKVENSITADSLELEGILTIRGIEKEIKTKVYIEKIKENLILTSKFIVNPDEFDINIPYIVKDKIAKQIEICVYYELNEKL